MLAGLSGFLGEYIPSALFALNPFFMFLAQWLLGVRSLFEEAFPPPPLVVSEVRTNLLCERFLKGVC
jgi:hypothetical protein